MTKQSRPEAIDLDDIDITDAFECLIVIEEEDYQESKPGPFFTCYLLSVDPDGYIQSESETLEEIFGKESK